MGKNTVFSVLCPIFPIRGANWYEKSIMRGSSYVSETNWRNLPSTPSYWAFSHLTLFHNGGGGGGQILSTKCLGRHNPLMKNLIMNTEFQNKLSLLRDMTIFGKMSLKNRKIILKCP